jgi:REP element-mobilizing transposase RayT
MIDEAHIAAEKQGLEVHFIATETTHVHVLVSWRSEKNWQKVRVGLRQSYTRRLNRDFERREWFVDGASRKRVKDRAHYDYLVETYLPAHSGWKWSKEKGCFR